MYSNFSPGLRVGTWNAACEPQRSDCYSIIRPFIRSRSLCFVSYVFVAPRVFSSYEILALRDRFCAQYGCDPIPFSSPAAFLSSTQLLGAPTGDPSVNCLKQWYEAAHGEDFVLDNFLLFIHSHSIDIGIIPILMRPFGRECSNPLTRTTFVPQPARPTPFI